jgi:four helix bundle protein
MINLQERTLKFSNEIIKLCKLVKTDIVSKRIVDQLVRSGTSIGANYMEAVNGSSRKDFKNKIFICKK